MNRVVLVGRLTKDVDLRYTAGGTAVASFTIAINRPFTNADGSKETDFINCIAWRKLAENTANFTKKGSQVAIDGMIQTRNYENSEGKRVYVTEVVSEHVRFLDKKEQPANEGSLSY